MEESMTVSPHGHRTVDAGRGTAWWTESWALFMKNPAMWLVFGVIFCAGFAVLGLIPLLGGLVAALVTQVVVGGWMLSARKIETGGSLEIADLFSGFQKERLNALVVLGALALAASAAIALLLALVGGGAVMGTMIGGAHRSAGGMMAGMGVGLLAMLIGLILAFVMAMAFWFAPALVVFHEMSALDALRASFFGCLKNIVPFLVYGLVGLGLAIAVAIVLGIVTVITRGFGVLLMFLLALAIGPIVVASIYTGYRDVFIRH